MVSLFYLNTVFKLIIPFKNCYCPIFQYGEDKDIQNNFVICFCMRCETWSLTLREKDKLQVLENKVLRKIFEPKNDEVHEMFRILHNEELHNYVQITLYC